MTHHRTTAREVAAEEPEHLLRLQCYCDRPDFPADHELRAHLSNVIWVIRQQDAGRLDDLGRRIA